MSWVSPTSHNDLDAWGNEENAYDGNTGNYAATLVSGGELELTIEAIACDKVRIYASDFEGVAGQTNPTVTISVYYDSAYHQIFSGSITKLTWVEKAIGSTETVTKVKISGTLDSSHFLYLYEFEFNSIPPTVETDACSDVGPTSLDANGDIIASGGATKRGFHYSKVFDNFEWGSDEAPLSDDGGAIDWSIVAAGTSKVEIDTAQHYTGTRSARFYSDGTNPSRAYFTQPAISSTQVISFALRKDDATYFVLWHGNGTKYIRVNIADNEDIQYYDGSNHSTGSSVSIDTWHVISIRNVNWAAGTYDIYLDGILIQSDAAMATSPAYANVVHFYNGTAVSTCWLDEVAVWDVEDEDGSFGEGEYSLEITGLDEDTTYYVQAFAKNAVGFGHGLVISQATALPVTPSPASAIGQVVAPTVIEGSTSITPTPASAIGQVVAPTIILGSTTATPEYIKAIGQVVAPIVIASGLFEHYNEGDVAGSCIHEDDWRAQTFTPSIAHQITSVKLKLARVGLPGTLTMGIRATDGEGKPTGADLCSGTTDADTLTTAGAGEWREITFSPGYGLTASTKYAIVIRALAGDSSNYVSWRGDNTSPTYANGSQAASVDAGSVWTLFTTTDMMFEDWGECSPIISVTPSPVQAIGSVIAPAIIFGSTTATPEHIDTLAQVVQPTVIAGNIILTPTPIDAIAKAVDPTVIYSAIIPDPISAIGSVVSPVIVLSSISITPTYIEAIGQVVAPIVSTAGTVYITPAAIDTIGGRVNPTVILGAITLTPSVISAIAQVELGNVKQGNIIFSPAFIKAIGQVVTPTVLGGSLTLEPESIEAIARGQNPEVILASMTVTPEFVKALAGVIAPTVLLTWIGRKVRLVIVTTQYRKVNVMTAQKRQLNILTTQKRKVKVLTGE